MLLPPVRHTGKLQSFQISKCLLCNRDAHPLLCKWVLWSSTIGSSNYKLLTRVSTCLEGSKHHETREGGEGTRETDGWRAQEWEWGTMLDDERGRGDVFVPLMCLSEVHCAAAWELEGHWITAPPRPFHVIKANLAPEWISFNKVIRWKNFSSNHCVKMSISLALNKQLHKGTQKKSTTVKLSEDGMSFQTLHKSLFILCLCSKISPWWNIMSKSCMNKAPK